MTIFVLLMLRGSSAFTLLDVWTKKARLVVKLLLETKNGVQTGVREKENLCVMGILNK